MYLQFIHLQFTISDTIKKGSSECLKFKHFAPIVTLNENDFLFFMSLAYVVPIFFLHQRPQN